MVDDDIAGALLFPSFPLVGMYSRWQRQHFQNEIVYWLQFHFIWGFQFFVFLFIYLNHSSCGLDKKSCVQLNQD